MASLGHKAHFPQKAFKFKLLTECQFYKTGRISKQYSHASYPSRHLMKNTSCLRATRLLTVHTKWVKKQVMCGRCYSSESLVWEEDGETLIRSPFKEVSVPKLSFTEYMFTKLDEYKHLDSVVSSYFEKKDLGWLV